jgi:Protein of unknown function (DUF3313)
MSFRRNQENNMNIVKTTSRLSLLIVGTILIAGCTPTPTMNKDLPPTTEDGLKLIPAKHVDALYWRDGATLKPYTAVQLVECGVAFKKDWMKDQNRDRYALQNRVEPEDMERIKTGLSELFDETFTKVLKEGGYNVVDKGGEGVLVLRPAIVNLDVTAPDLRTAGAVQTYTTSAGEMTLYMELYDSPTGAKIGQVMDRQRSMDDGHVTYTNSVTNRAEANRMLRKWAGLLVDALDEAKAQ